MDEALRPPRRAAAKSDAADVLDHAVRCPEGTVTFDVGVPSGGTITLADQRRCRRESSRGGPWTP